jgi:hypothetical protein
MDTMGSGLDPGSVLFLAEIPACGFQWRSVGIAEPCKQLPLSSFWMPSWFFVARGNAFGRQRRAAVGKQLFLPGVELCWRPAGRLADPGNRLLLDQMKPRQPDLVVRGPVPSFFLRGLAPKTSSTPLVTPLSESSSCSRGRTSEDSRGGVGGDGVSWRPTVAGDGRRVWGSIRSPTHAP